MFVFLNPANENHNAFGFAAHGWLTRSTGERARFTG